jgi:hypothetical protein
LLQLTTKINSSDRIKTRVKRFVILYSPYNLLVISFKLIY